ncbi:MAG: toxin [Candidatus Aminicenantes bacterium]|nr:toxin [Candidatus Aminicenantes bacterium]
MKIYDWDKDKNEWLKKKRGISFEDIVAALDQGKKLDSYKHPNLGKYPGQEILVVEIDQYAYLVPLLEDSKKVFFKTIYRSRKATKKYLKLMK